MANVTVRHFAIYLKGKKLATAESISADIDTGRSPMHGSEGLMTFSKGSVMWTVTIGGPEPVSGSDVSELIEKIVRQEDVACRLLAGGKVYEGDMACTKVGLTSDSKTGEAKNTYTMSGRLTVRA